jgi:hypothetical protein
MLTTQQIETIRASLIEYLKDFGLMELCGQPSYIDTDYDCDQDGDEWVDYFKATFTVNIDEVLSFLMSQNDVVYHQDMRKYSVEIFGDELKKITMNNEFSVRVSRWDYNLDVKFDYQIKTIRQENNEIIFEVE